MLGEAGLVNQPDELQDRISRLFRLAKSSVDEELNGHHGQREDTRGNGHGRSENNGRPATQSQCRAILAIADRQRTDLVGLLRDRFQVDRVEDLSISEASGLIDELKESANGTGGRQWVR